MLGFAISIYKLFIGTNICRINKRIPGIYYSTQPTRLLLNSRYVRSQVFSHKLISRCSFHFFLLLSIRVPRTRAPYTTVRNMTRQERIRRCSLCLCHLNLQNLKEKNSLAKSYHPKKRTPPEKHITVKTNCKCRSVSLRLHQRRTAHQSIITTRLISIVLLSSCPKDSQNNTSDYGKLML